MKKLIAIFLFFLMTAYAACLGEEEGNILNLSGGSGVDSVVVNQDKAYVSLDFDTWAGSVHGFAVVDISDPSKFIKFDGDIYGSYDDYFAAIAETTKVFKYANDFIFDENTTVHMRLTNLQTEGDNIYLYGYANAENNASYLFKITINNSVPVNVDYKKTENSEILSEFSSDGLDYYIVKMSNGYFFVLKAFYDSYTSPLTMQTFPITDENSQTSLVADDEYMYMKLNGKIYRVELSINSASDITSLFPIEVDRFLAYKCDYLIFSYNFENLVMLNTQTYDYSSVKVWDPAQGVIAGNTFFLANYGAMINAINISDPKNIYIDSNTSEWALNDFVTYYNGKIYVGGGWRGLAVYDAQNCDVTESTFCETSQSNDINEESEETTQTEETSTSNDTDLNDISECCITADDINALPSGWNMLGSGCDITDMSIFNNIKIVWQYKNGQWYAYTYDLNIKALLDQYGIIPLDHINKKEGFWINK